MSHKNRLFRFTDPEVKLERIERRQRVADKVQRGQKLAALVQEEHMEELREMGYA